MAKIIRERVITDIIETVDDTIRELPKPQKKTSGCSWLVLIVIVSGIVCLLWGNVNVKDNGVKGDTRHVDKSSIKKGRILYAKQSLGKAGLWEGRPGVWFLKRENKWSAGVYKRLAVTEHVSTALKEVNGRLPTKAEMNNPPSRR